MDLFIIQILVPFFFNIVGIIQHYLILHKTSTKLKRNTCIILHTMLKPKHTREVVSRICRACRQVSPLSRLWLIYGPFLRCLLVSCNVVCFGCIKEAPQQLVLWAWSFQCWSMLASSDQKVKVNIRERKERRNKLCKLKKKNCLGLNNVCKWKTNKKK